MSSLKGIRIQRERDIDPKTHGHIRGVPVGTRWDKRVDCSQDGVHAPLRAGIHGTADSGAYSIVMSGGYEDDEDYGDTFIYTGQGGRDLEGTRLDKMRGTSLWKGAQSADQVWLRGNKALKVSYLTGMPVRVVRGSNLDSKYRPAEGYRYDGLYTVVDAWQEEGKKEFKMCKFKFERVKGQPPLPFSGTPVVTPRAQKSTEDGGQYKRRRILSSNHNANSIKKSGKRRETFEGISFKWEGSNP